MSEKTLYYAQLAEDTARRLTGNWERWAGFLATAGRLYKYPYPDQLMIYAQRPDAIACASYDVWNDRMNRYVRRGSKGIALLDDAGDRLRLRYVFDLADTGTRANSRDPWLWTLEDRHRIPVAAMLERRYGTDAADLSQQLADAAGQLADAYWADHGQEIGGILANSLLEEYDELNRGLAFKRAVTASTTFALLSRCGYAPENHFGAETFRNIYEFNTPATVAALGTAVSESSREVLLQIAAVVRQVEREVTEERRLWDEQHSIAVHAERGLSGPEHRAEPAGEALGQVRQDAEKLSEGEPARPLQPPAVEREAVPAPGGDRPDSEGPLGPADGGAAETEPGPGQSGAADGLGAAHERSENAGRGSNPERADLQLSFFATEAEQIEQIDQRAETEQVSAFSFSEADWRAALASGSGFANGKERIAAYYAEHHSAKERTAFLKQEYGTGGQSWTFQDGSNGFLDYDASGVKLRSYPNGQEQRLKWPEVEKRIHVLIATGQYLDEREAEKPAAKRYQVIVYHQTEGGLDERQEYPTLEEAERAVQGYMDGTLEPDGFAYDGAAVYDLQEKTYLRVFGAYPDETAQSQVEVKESIPTARDPLAPAYQKGDTVYLEGSPYEITRVSAYHVELLPPGLAYPVFRSEPKERFEQLLARDERNVSITEYLTDSLSAIDPDLEEALTMEGGLLDAGGREELSAAFRAGEGNSQIAQRLAERYSEEADIVELVGGDLADYRGTQVGFELVIQDKYETTISRSWGEVARTLRTLYQVGQGEFVREPKAMEQAESVREPVDLAVSESTQPERLEPETTDSAPAPPELADTPATPAKPDASVVPTLISEPVAFYPADKNGLPYDIAVERLHVEPQQPEIPAPPARNFRITDEHLGEGGPKQKFACNIEAIRTLQAIEAEGRSATPEEQTVLSQYVGWGGLADAFDPDKDSWAREYTQLKELLSPEEYAAARASTLNAHYTSPTVIRAIYDAVEQMGFRTGNILEPSCGVGNFFGMLPESMQGSRLYGVELDSITGRIARQLYPEANITVAGFETTSQRDFYDLAVGNVPFGNYKVNDKAYNNLGFSIHNYFFAKALDQVRPGGVVAFVTSRFTMDSKDSTARKYLAQRADLLGAVRLPNNAFKANAGTEVVSDILFLQKLERPIDREPEWVQVGQTPEGFTVNQYFVDHPEMILGELSAESTQYGREDVTVDPIEGANLAEQLKSAMAHINGRYEVVERVSTELDEGAPDVLPADPGVKNFSYTVVDGEIYYRENSVMASVNLNGDAKERVKGMVELRGLVNELIVYQLEDFPDADIAAKQAELNAAYDAFTAKYGLLNDRKNGRLFDDDSSYYLLCSLENLDENGKLKSKADMFTKRTIRPERTVTHVDTPAEALAVSIGEKGRVDLSYMAELLGTPEEFERITGELRGVIFRDPSDQNWKTADEYLSGNVRNKLQIARLAAANDPVFVVNVEALTKAQPKELEASEIDVRLGATWISPDIIQKFMNETFQIPFYLRYAIRVKFSPATAEWRIEGKTKTGRNDVMAYETFGTARASAYKILEDTLNLRDARVYDTVEDDSGKPKRVLNKKETMLAGQKQQAIKDAFANWVWQDPQRREMLVRQYNELFNSTRPREYDGSHIHFVGMNPEISLREHQRNAIAHVLYGGNTLLAHEVGAGKTFEMAASAMEAKRLGLCQKSLFVVPNHLTLQWAQEFLHLYPSAKLLVASKKDFETANRKKFCARIATGDYDAVIIGHSQFEKIPLSFERQERIIREQIDEIQSGIAELKHSSGEKFTIKQMEKSRKQLEMKLEKLRGTERKDDVVTFEELGVDRLFVDESHSFKNLFLVTKMRNVAGLSTSEAQKSSDMFGKCRYMDELTGGRGVVFATGTPVSNSMVELFTAMRYLQYGTLQQKGLMHFDCWASTFGETTTSIELAPEGTGYRARTRFAKFFNLPELMTMFKEVADIKTSDQLHLPVPEAEFETVLVKPSETQKEMVQSLSERAGKINAGMVDPSEDNMLKITSDGRKIGLDQRLMNPLLPDDPNSKLNACVSNVLRIWEEGKSDKLTQLLFCDLSTPKGDGQFNVYDDVKKKLLAAGVPESEVAFIHAADTEAKKKELFSKVRTGQVRILLGSTAKMGAGTNVQDRLVAVHHLDVGWKPSDMTQRNGRIIRQGNRNKTVQIYNYVTEGTFDAYLWQTLENKQRFIGQIMTSKSPVRSCEDVDEQVLSYAEVKALCAGNPLIKEKMNLDVEVAKLKVLKADHQSQKYRLEDKLLKEFPASIQCQKAEIATLQQDAKTAEANPQVKDGFCGMTVKGMHFEDKLAAGERLLLACKEMPTAEAVTLGSYRGFGLDLRFDTFRNEYQAVLRGVTSHFVPLGTDARGNLTRMDNVLDSFPDRIARAENQLQTLYQQRDAAQQEVQKPFPKEAELAEKSARLAELDALLNMESRPEPEQEEPEAEQDEQNEERRPSVLAGLKAAAAEKPARDKSQKKEEPER